MTVPASKAASTTLVLIRHGETAGNREGRFQTYDTPLSDVGRAQAVRLAERIVSEWPVQAIYTSDLARAWETAVILGGRLGLTPSVDPALREVDVGDWKGLLRAEVEDQYPGGFQGWLAGGGLERLPGEAGECIEDVARRVAACIDRIVAAHPGERVVVISHGVTLAVLLSQIHGWDRVEALVGRRVQLGNTAVSIVEVDIAGERRCVLLGCTAHLDEAGVAMRAV